MPMAVSNQSASPPYLVVCFCVTAGQNGENLGSDEEQIVFFVYLLYDIANNKVVALHHQYIRPTADDISETVLTEECKIQTGLPEADIKNAQYLDQVIDEFDRFITKKEVHPEHGGKPFCFLADGPLHFRMCIHPEASRKNIQLPNHFNKYLDIRKEFKKFYKVEVVNCIGDMLDFLGLDPVDQSVEYGIRHCQDMANIVQRLLNDGHQFVDVEVIKDKLEPGICSKNDVVEEESVVRARGLPWQSSDQDIARFFKGLNVAKGGVALCLSQQGRRNGEALVRFDSKEHRDLALRKHKHHLGQRYIEVYRASGKDFVNIAGGSNTEAQVFLSRHGDNGNQVIVRMRGLPYSCTAEQVLEFFRSEENGPSVEVLDGEDGILFVHQADGRATGDAFVLFPVEDEAAKGLGKHRQCIGTRYIELFKSTTAEVQQVLNRSMDPRTPTSSETHEISMPALLPQIPGIPPSPGMPGAFMPQQIITSGTQRDCIRMRGLPFEATVTDILTFLGEHSRNIVYQGVHMVFNAQGTPSGEAFIQMDSDQAAEIAALTKHKKFMFMGNKKRYIEVIQCSGEDMNLVLTNGITAGLQNAMMMPGAQGLLQRPLISPGGTLMPPPGTAFQPGPMSPMVSMSSASPGSGGLQLMPGMASMAGMAGLGGAGLPNGVTVSNGYGPHAVYPSPFGHMQPGMIPQQPAAFVQAPTNGVTAGTMPHMTTPHPNGALAHLAPRGLPVSMSAAAAAAAAAGAAGAGTMPSTGYSPYQPILYWYPSPPVSPQSAYFMQQNPTTVAIKGLPYNAQATDLMAFFDGICEVAPDIQLQRGPDGRANGEAYVTFGSRTEAERAITERNRKLIGNRFVELHMA